VISTIRTGSHPEGGQTPRRPGSMQTNGGEPLGAAEIGELDLDPPDVLVMGDRARGRKPALGQATSVASTSSATG
jgi:hypothetical protein